MHVSVIVPFAGDCAYRARAREWVCEQYEAVHRGFEILVSAGDAEVWCKAAAVDAGVQRAHGDVLVIADADCWSDDLAQAVDAVDAGARWAAPHRRVHRLDAASSERFMAGDRAAPKYDRAPYRGIVGGGIVVVDRELYSEVPLDRRFIGWGGEDIAWGHALRTIGGKPAQGAGILWHLWHPHQPTRNGGQGSKANKQLRGEYVRARNHPQLMRDLLEDACRSRSSSTTGTPASSSAARSS